MQLQWKQQILLGLKGFQGDLNMSLSIPIDPKVHPLIPLPYSSNMDHEAFETVSDLGHLKDFRNGSSFTNSWVKNVHDDFDLGSSSMTHEFVNDDFDLNLSPPSKKKRTS